MRRFGTRLLRPWLALYLTLSAAGCGGETSSAPRATSPFQPQHLRAFDGRVDFINDPEILERNWQDEWNDDLQRRVSYANAVAVVRIEALRSTTDPEQKTVYHLLAQPETAILGTMQPEFDLRVREGDLGFTSVHRNQQQILQHMFIVFLKWADDSDGSVVARWHLSPATDAVLRRTRFLVQQRRGAPSP